ncbi:MAG: hypothetical protein LBB13_02565 [Rickettsiales bacterium]|nr:hypothetical protein [Rickettsiales bacterium]
MANDYKNIDFSMSDVSKYCEATDDTVKEGKTKEECLEASVTVLKKKTDCGKKLEEMLPA